MTMHDDIETRLRRAVDVTPSEDDLRWLDERVAQIMNRPSVLRRDVPTPRRFLRPLALAAALVLLAGAVGAAVGLLDRTVESSGSLGWRTAWDRAEILGIRETDAGVTITLERAYADLNRVLVGFTVEGLEPAPISSHGEPAPIEWRADLRDPSGRTVEEWATTIGASGLDETDLSAVVETWEGAVAPVAGKWELTFTSVGYNSGGMVPGECAVGATDPACVNPPPNAMIDGTWRFAFELPTPAGTIASPNVSDTVGSATVTLTQLLVTPTMVRARIALSMDDGVVRNWGWLNGSVQHGDASYTFNTAYHVTQDPNDQGAYGDVNEFMADAGSDEAAGTWVIEIPKLSYAIGDAGPEIPLDGPWTLTVTVP